MTPTSYFTPEAILKNLTTFAGTVCVELALDGVGGQDGEFVQGREGNGAKNDGTTLTISTIVRKGKTITHTVRRH